MLVSVRMHGMTEEDNVFQENLSFPSFSKLMEAARCTNESISRSLKPGTSTMPGQAPIGQQTEGKSPTFMAHTGEARSSGSKRPTFERNEKYPVLPPFPYSVKRVIVLLDQWVRDRVIRLPYVEHFLPEKTRRMPTTVPTIAKEGGTANVHEAPFSRHQDRGNDHVVMAYHSVANDELTAPEVELSTDDTI